jgi:hypothetical protein
MWWIIIIGVFCVAIFLALNWAIMIQAKAGFRESVLEKIATNYIERRSKGETMDDVRDSLYKHFSLKESFRFKPIPFGDLMLILFTEKMPDDALRLGEITYTILCHKGSYPLPRDGLGAKDHACQYDALVRICGKCKIYMVHHELVSDVTSKWYQPDQSWKIDPAIPQMMKKWSALVSEISTVNARLKEAVRPPPRPEMHDITEGVRASEGLFGTKWLMPMEEVVEIAPQPVPYFQDMVDNFYHFGKYHGRQASFSYYFENNLLTKIWVCHNKSSEKQFRRMQTRLSTDFGSMSVPAPSEDYKLLSRGDFNKLMIEHWLKDDERAGLTEMIKFRSTAKSS